VRGLLAAALVEAGIVTYRDLSANKVLPPPSDYVAVAIVFGGLSLFPESASGFTSLFGWGIVLATWLNLWSPQTPTKLAVPGGTATAQAGKQTTVTPAPTVS
jgi:hypothetical protein